MAPKSSMKAKVYVFIYTWIGSAYFENILKIRKKSSGKFVLRKSVKKLWILKSVKIRTSRFFSPEGAPRNALLPLNYFFTCKNTSDYKTKSSTNSLLSFLFFFSSFLLFFFSSSFPLIFFVKNARRTSKSDWKHPHQDLTPCRNQLKMSACAQTLLTFDPYVALGASHQYFGCCYNFRRTYVENSDFRVTFVTLRTYMRSFVKISIFGNFFTGKIPEFNCRLFQADFW